METLTSFSAFLHPPLQGGFHNTRRLSSTVNRQIKSCKGFLESARSFKTGSIKHFRLTGFQDGPRKRDINQIIKAGETEASTEDETIKGELQAESDRITQEEEAAEKQSMQKSEAEKKSEGLGEHEKCWVLRSSDKAQGTSYEVISGEGIMVGAAPLVSGSIKPLVVDLPMVSSAHARVYGKDVVKSYNKSVREYFVVDLGSTNGTYLNRSKLRPQTEVKLSCGDTLKFGDEKAVFVVESQ